MNLSEDCAGLSNVFGPAPFADATRAAAAMAADLPLVGYESGSQLDAATAAGFAQTGTLRFFANTPGCGAAPHEILFSARRPHVTFTP